MENPEYVMFFDNHTSKFCSDVGHDLDADQFAATIRDIGADLIGFHAKCNQGFCYYDTKIGHRHPSLRPGHDYFGEVVEACRKQGIKVTAYFNCGLSNEDGVVHPEWCQIKKDGTIFHPEILGTMVTPYARVMCINSPYRDHLISMIKEVKEKYPVSGFLLDSFNGFPCYCRHCIEGMRAMGFDPEKEEDAIKFAKISSRRLAQDISDAVEPRKNGYLMFCLGLSARDNLKYGSYLECECLPTVPCWGYDFLPMKARYLRTLPKNGEPVLNMTGRFYNWGDFGSLRTDAAIEYDMFFGLANGMRPNIGDHIHPSGIYYPGIAKGVKRIYSKLKQYDSWYRGATNPVDMAVLFPGMATSNTSKAVIRMLSELNMQFDCIDEISDWDKYRLIVLPDYIVLTEELQAKMDAFLKSGGKVLATGESGLNPEKTAFCFEKEWGVRFEAGRTFDPPYFTMVGEYSGLIPELPLSVYDDCMKVEALAGTKVAGKIVAPYFDKDWDGVYAKFYTPPRDLTDLPFVTMTEQVAYCSGKLFAGYYKAASVELRHVFKAMLEHLLSAPLLKVSADLPSFARSFVSEQPGRRMVHLLNYMPELRGEMLIVEESLAAYNIEVKLRLDGRKAAKVVLAPTGEELPFVQDGDYAVFTFPKFCGYGLAAVEFAE